MIGPVVLALAGLWAPDAVDPAPGPSGGPSVTVTSPTPDADVRSRGGAPLSAEDKARRNAVVEALLAAEAQATENPESAESVLLEALRNFGDVAPMVAEDDYAQSARVYAQLALARTRLVLDQPAGAAAALDTALRIARGTALPVNQFGPTLVALHDERAAVLGGLAPATLAVDCAAPCRVFVDERPYDGESLVPGHHRVWVEAEAPGVLVLRREVDLEPGEQRTLDYDRVPPPVVPTEPAEDTPPTTTAPPAATTPSEAPGRILPRWATVFGLATGVAVTGVGAALVAVDHRCPSLEDPRQVDCLNILDTDAGGWTLVGLGSAAVITSAVLLTVDEVRTRRARRRGRAAHARRAR